MRRTMVVVAAVAGLGWAASGLAQQARDRAPSSPFEYAVFGLGDVTLQDGVRAIDGDVGSNNGTTIVGQGVRVAGAVVGRTIKLRKNALPDSLFCLLLKGSSGTLQCQAVTLPIVSTAQLPPVQVVPGTMNVTIPSESSHSPAPAGAYGKLKIGSRATLVLAGGTYVFRSIRVNSRGQLLCAAPCQIGVADTMKIQSRGIVGGTSGTRAESIRVNVAKTSSNAVFSADQNSNVSAVVYAPGGRIVLRGGKQSYYVGAFVGGSVKVGKNALVQARSP
jgi:hypothetical protein